MSSAHLTAKVREGVESSGRQLMPCRSRANQDVRLPPAKVAASATAGQLTNAPLPTARSPLSPYTPTSPLYPDGLIAPIWVRKHTYVVQVQPMTNS